jgi:parallel beta-helix repeat protein
MQNSHRIVAATLVLGTLAVPALAGDLNPPPGPVAPTGKTLTEVEPRIAVNATNTPGDADSVFRIIQSGSYYLTGNVSGQAAKHGIQIEVDGVTLDLNGYTLIGTAGSLDGINMLGFRENVVIRNGHVRGWGQSGIETRIDIGRIEYITAAGNGAWGIDNAPSGTFTSHITSCEALDNGGLVASTGGIRGGQASAITDCVSYSNTGTGITVGSGSNVSKCIARSNSVDGITASSASTVTGCTANSNTADGIRVSSDCQVVGNTCIANGSGTGGDGAGIHASGIDIRIEANVCADADRGIDVDSSGNFIARNTCTGNTTNWEVVAGNVILVINATAAGAVNGNSGGTAPGSTDPNANFTY